MQTRGIYLTAARLPKLAIVWSVCVLIAASATRAQDISDSQKPFVMAGLKLELGQSEEAILKQFKAQSTLVVSSSEDEASQNASYTVSRKPLSAANSVIILGYVDFTKGKLTSATKHWFLGTNGSSDLVKALQDALAEISVGVVTPLIMNQGSHTTQEAHTTTTTFYCGKRQVLLTTYTLRGESVERVQVDEILKDF